MKHLKKMLAVLLLTALVIPVFSGTTNAEAKSFSSKKVKILYITKYPDGNYDVKWKKLSGAFYYQVQLSTTKNFRSYSTVNVKKGVDIDVTNVKRGVNYFVRVRAVSSRGAVSKWSKKWNVKKKKAVSSAPVVRAG